MVRAGCERAEISAEFDINQLTDLQAWLKEQELEGDEGICLLRRTLDAGGRSRGFINGRSATLQQMREAGEYLLDIHGQHAHQSLLKQDVQRDLLDSHADLHKQKESVAFNFKAWQVLHRRRTLLEQNAEAVAAERDLLVFQRRDLGMALFFCSGVEFFACRSFKIIKCGEPIGNIPVWYRDI